MMLTPDDLTTSQSEDELTMPCSLSTVDSSLSPPRGTHSPEGSSLRRQSNTATLPYFT